MASRRFPMSRTGIVTWPRPWRPFLRIRHCPKRSGDGRDLRDRRIGLPASALQAGGPRVHALRGAIAVLESEGLFFRHVQWVDLPPAAAVSLTLPSAYSEEIAALKGLVQPFKVGT